MLKTCILWVTLLMLNHALATTQEFQLDNGLKVIIKPLHRAPVVVSQIWYKVGSSYEHLGISGVSHALEHMMFKGTPKVPLGEFSKTIAVMGGKENAFTSKDYTAYFQRIEKRHLRRCLALEADRMQNLLLQPEEFAKEIKVVMEERRLRTEDKPQSLTYEHFISVAYQNHPYRIPVIGWMNDLENLTIDDVKTWYKRWYVPNNATLVIVGDVEPKQVMQWVKEYFGGLEPGYDRLAKAVHEVSQLGQKSIEVHQPAKLPYFIMGYKVPSLQKNNTQDTYALEVLAGILDGGESARLAKQLDRKLQLTASVGAGYSLYSKWSSLFTLSAVPAQGKTVDEVMQALMAEIKKLQQGQVTTEELSRVKAQVIAANIYEQDSLFYQAMVIGVLETIGISWRESERYVAEIRKVSAEQVQAVAKKYLIAKHLTTATLYPQALEGVKQ